ncbi:hypothetical protein ACFL08_01000 [Patescibacteria group bacterium]
MNREEILAIQQELFSEGIDIMNAEYCAYILLNSSVKGLMSVQGICKRLKEIRTYYVRKVLDKIISWDTNEVAEIQELRTVKDFLEKNYVDRSDFGVGTLTSVSGLLCIEEDHQEQVAAVRAYIATLSKEIAEINAIADHNITTSVIVEGGLAEMLSQCENSLNTLIKLRKSLQH